MITAIMTQNICDVSRSEAVALNEILQARRLLTLSCVAQESSEVRRDGIQNTVLLDYLLIIEERISEGQ
jgi:hypothetical protein